MDDQFVIRDAHLLKQRIPMVRMMNQMEKAKATIMIRDKPSRQMQCHEQYRQKRIKRLD